MTSENNMGGRIKEQTARVKGHRYKVFVVDHGVTTKPNGERGRYRKVFKTYAKAARYLREYDLQQEIWKEKEKVLKRRIGEDARKLSNQQLRDALSAYHKLSGKASLADAVEFYLEHGQLKTPRKLNDFYDDYIHFRQVTKRRRQRTVEEIRFRIGRLKKTFGERHLHTIKKAELQAWMEKQGGSAINQHHYRAQLAALFKRAVDCDHVSEKLNPARGLEVPEAEKKAPCVTSVKDVEKVLRYTAQDHPSMIPYMAICFFAGIRPMECERLTWDKINFDTKRIQIDAAVSKTKAERYVDMSDNLVSWLLPHRQNEGAMHFSRKAFDNVRTKCGVQWKSDCMRHSFGTYHVKLYENAGKTALQMGHKNTGILFDHYLNARFTQEDAKRFFEIRPEIGKTVAFPAHAVSA